MPSTSSPSRRRYMKVSHKSGCISVDYNLIETDADSEIVPYDDNETSGMFTPRQPRRQT